jgi:hypothetical protein
VAPEWLVACPKRPSTVLPDFLAVRMYISGSHSVNHRLGLQAYKGMSLLLLVNGICIRLSGQKSVTTFTFEVSYSTLVLESGTSDLFVLLIRVEYKGTRVDTTYLISSFSSSHTIYIV